MADGERLTDFEKAIRSIGQVEEERTRNFMESNFPVRTGPDGVAHSFVRDRGLGVWGQLRDSSRPRVGSAGTAQGGPIEGSNAAADALIAAGVDPALAGLLGDQLFAEEEPEYLGYPSLKPYDPRHPSEGWTPYVAGDEFDILQRLPTEGLRRYQDRMAALGLIDEVVPGRIDQNTIKGFKGLLEYANQNGMQWSAALRELETMKERGELDWMDEKGATRAPFVAPTYLAPDYATLAQTVKGQLRQELGRDPDESELALLTAELSGWDREAFDNEVAAARAEYDAAEEGRDVPAVAQGVDPLARFRESFEQKFRGEIQGIERTEEAAETSENVRGAVSTLSQLSGGMG